MLSGTLAENYVIELQSGALTVLDRQIGYEITLVPKSRTYEYDGKTMRTSGFETLSFEIGGQTYTVSGVGASAEGIDAGTYPVNITGKLMVSVAVMPTLASLMPPAAQMPSFLSTFGVAV